MPTYRSPRSASPRSRVAGGNGNVHSASQGYAGCDTGERRAPVKQGAWKSIIAQISAHYGASLTNAAPLLDATGRMVYTIDVDNDQADVLAAALLKQQPDCSVEHGTKRSDAPGPHVNGVNRVLYVSITPEAQYARNVRADRRERFRSRDCKKLVLALLVIFLTVVYLWRELSPYSDPLGGMVTRAKAALVNEANS